MFARYQRAVGSIDDSGTSNSEPTGRDSLPALPWDSIGSSRKLDSSSVLDLKPRHARGFL